MTPDRTTGPVTAGGSVEQKIESHLTQALAADSPDAKNYHIRSALQLCVVRERTSESSPSQTG
ncbi:MAG: hypothetical protein ABEH61_02255 [Haloarculaceae archaeon]